MDSFKALFDILMYVLGCFTGLMLIVAAVQNLLVRFVGPRRFVRLGMTYYFNQEYTDRLIQLRILSESTSARQVFTRALDVYEIILLWKLKYENGEIIFRAADGSEKPFEV